MKKNTITRILVVLCLLQTTILPAQITRHAAVAAPAKSQFKNIGKVDNFLIFGNELDQKLWGFNIITNQVTAIGTRSQQLNETLDTKEGIYWFEEVRSGRSEIYYWAARNTTRQKLYEFDGTKGAFIGTTEGVLVARAGNKIIAIEPSGSVRELDPAGDAAISIKGSWRNMVYWFDQSAKAFRRYKAGEQHSVLLGQFTSVHGVHPMGQDLLVWGDSKIIRTDGTENNSIIIFDWAPTDVILAQPTISVGDSVKQFNLFVRGGLTQAWRTNGTSAGTYQLTGTNAPFLKANHSVTKNGQTFFIAQDNNAAWQIWRTNGTAAGTVPIENLSKKFGLRTIRRGIRLSDERIVFIVETTNEGIEPAIFEGGQLRLLDMRKGVGSSISPSSVQAFQVFEVGNTVFLPANDGDYGQELWQVDGSNAMRLGDIAAGSAWSESIVLGEYNGKVYWLSGNPGIPYAIYSKNISQQIAQLPDPQNSIDWFQSIQTPPSPDDSKEGFSVYTRDIARTPGGLLYVTGLADSLSDTNILFTRDRADNVTNPSKGNYFLAQLDHTGIPIWKQRIPTTHYDYNYAHVAQAPYEGIYWSGNVAGKGFVGSQNVSLGLWGVPVIAHISRSGYTYWLHPLSNVEEIRHICSDAEGNVFITGEARGNAEISGIELENSSRHFVAKYNPDGRIVWAKSLPFRLDAPIAHMALDTAGNLYLLTEDEGRDVSFNAPIAIGKVVCIEAATGQPRWEKKFESKEYRYPTIVAVSPKGIVHVLGIFENSLTIGSFKISYRDLDKRWEDKIGYLAKLDSDGNLIDFRVLGEDLTVGKSIAFDEKDNYYIAGYQEVPKFTTSLVHNYNPFPKGKNRTFVKAYTPWHELLGERSFGVEHKFIYSSLTKVLLTPGNKVILMGEYKGMVDTLPGGSGNITDQSVYLMQFELPLKPLITIPPDGNLADIDIKISPNPTAQVAYVRSNDADLFDSSIELYDMAGRPLLPVINRYDAGSFLIDLSQQPSGVYVVVMRLGNQRITRRLVKL